MKKAVILQYYDDTFTEKEGKKKKIHEASSSKSFGSWRGRLLCSSLAGNKQNSADATLRKTQQQ